MENIQNESSIQETTRSTQHECARVSFTKTVAIGVILGVLFGFFGGFIAFVIAPHLKDRLPEKITQMLFPASVVDTIEKRSVVAEDSAVIETVEQSSPAVVSIVISRDVPKLQNMFGFPFFFTPRGGNQGNSSETEKQTVGQGSGFLVSADGLIVTNKHVVSDSGAEYTVMTNDGKKYSAKVLARDPNRDIALIKIDAENMPFLELGDSDEIKVGQTVIAIGNSLGEFSNTVSKGIVSGLRRSLIAGSNTGDEERLSNIIQTDAAINPGNSGGPLLNISGRVIGVNVAMAQGAENIGFALPANQIKRVIDQVRSTGKITTAFLGVRYIMLTPEIQKENSLPLDHGALILRGEKMTDFAVIPGSPADKAGLMENDIILEIDGVEINSDHAIADTVADRQVGDTLKLTIWHKGETKTVDVVLEERK